MPRLHQYRNRNGCYVLTAIRGAVITCQLTPEGERKLTDAGIAPGQQFQRALLLDLYRTGDAFTYGGGVDDSSSASAGQLEMDFANDPDPETAFPACDDCRGVNDLHLTVAGSADHLAAKLQCAACRGKAAVKPDTSIPTSLLSLPLLNRLFRLKAIPQKDKNVIQFEELLHRELESRWEAVKKSRGASQKDLFDSGPGDELRLK